MTMIRSALKRTLLTLIGCAAAVCASPQMQFDGEPGQPNPSNNTGPTTLLSRLDPIWQMPFSVRNLVAPNFGERYRNLDNKYWVVIFDRDMRYQRLACLGWPLEEDPATTGSAQSHLGPNEQVRSTTTSNLVPPRIADCLLGPWLLSQYANSYTRMVTSDRQEIRAFVALRMSMMYGGSDREMTSLRKILNNPMSNGVGVDTGLSIRRRLVITHIYSSNPIKQMVWHDASYDDTLALFQYLEVTRGLYLKNIRKLAKSLDRLFHIDNAPDSAQVGARFRFWAQTLMADVLGDIAEHLRFGREAPIWVENNISRNAAH